MSKEAKSGRRALLTPEESVVVLIDHQPFQFANLHSHEPTMIVNKAAGEGFEVFAVTDASGGASKEAHDMAVQRMIQAGVVPITWTAVLGEWQRDWAREKTVPGTVEVQAQHGGASGIAFSWETQLLTVGDGSEV